LPGAGAVAHRLRQVGAAWAPRTSGRLGRPPKSPWADGTRTPVAGQRGGAAHPL